MPTIKKLDSKRRVVFPDSFAPGDLFLEESSVSEGKITFSLLVPDQAPLAQTTMDGDQLIIETPLARESVRKAIRQDRDRR